ncbi:LysR substrate-binding domain-containing protein [Paraburkholderia sp. ZP32-5]|uniref:LysR substrate-binding domain-containing protein n=1 Tax=Paraburkholderia sp. ZP32-5 TaxID=2883245 RepID=UPI001F3CE8EC|nr:LysR substrate-binding domain-containing protein [Paraburkholderia sp. ZP32-5]
MNNQLPPLKALRVFECASRHLSFTEAAHELNISQSAVSHQIRSLEEWLGFRLFERSASASRLTLTPGASVYGATLTHCLSRIAVATQELVATGPHQILNLRGYSTFFTQWLIPRLADFQSAHPDIKLRLTSGVEPVDFRHDHVDLGIVYGDGSGPGWRHDLIFSDELIPVLAPKLAVRLNAERSLDSLFALPFLHSRLRDQWSDWIRAVGGERSLGAHDMFFEDVSIVFGFALEGLGVALVQRKYAVRDLAAGRLITPHPFVLRRARGYHLVCPPERADEDKIVRLRDWLLTAARAEA